MRRLTTTTSKLALVQLILVLGTLKAFAMPQIASIGKTICDLTLWSPGEGRHAPLRKDATFSFDCSLRDRGFGDGSVIITNLNTNESFVSGTGGWASGRRCLYKEGFADICTRAEWRLINK